MDVMSRQSRRLICQTVHGSLSTNSVKPTQPVSVSKARPRASRSSSAVEGRRATDETQRPTTHRVRVPGEKTRKSEPSTQRGYEPSTQSSSWRAPARELAKGVGKTREPQKRAQASQSVFLSPDQVLQATSKERWTPGFFKRAK